MRAMLFASFVMALSSSAVAAAELSVPGGRAEPDVVYPHTGTYWGVLPGCIEITAPALIHCQPSPPADPVVVALKSIRGPHREPYGTLYPTRTFGRSFYFRSRRY